MKFFIDTEFINTGAVIDLVSIGIVCENGKELYRECCDFDPSQATPWVKANVIALLSPIPGSTRRSIAYDVKTFIDTQCSFGDQVAAPEFWGDYCAFDFVLLSQLFGTFDDWPEGWPFFMHDLQQHIAWVKINPQSEYRLPDEIEHHALHDARSIKRQYDDIAAEVALLEVQP